MASHDSSEVRFADYVAALVGVIGHADRATPLRDYCTGLLMPAERKSVEPMAAITAPARVAAQHQSLLHFVGQAPWSDAAVLTKVRDLVLPAIERAGPIEAWIIDDTGFPKKGRHSVGVARGGAGWRVSIADNSASRIIARWLGRSRLPIARPACRSPIASTCRRSGLTIQPGAKKPVCPRRSPSRPSPRLRSTRSGAARLAAIPAGESPANRGVQLLL